MRAIDQNRTEKTFAPGQAKEQRKTMRRSTLVASASGILLASAIGAFALPTLTLRPVPNARTITIEFHSFGKSYALVGTLADPRALERLGMQVGQDKL